MTWMDECQKMYDEEYFTTDKKSNYSKGFWDWEKRKVLVYSFCIGTFKEGQPKKILELGCAKGTYVRGYRELGKEAYGVDVSKWVVENSYESVREFIKQGDISEKIPFPENTFDFITAIDILEHIPFDRLDNTIEEIKRVAVNDAVLFIEMPINTNDDSILKTEGPQSDEGHICILPVYMWVKKFFEHGFILKTIFQFGPAPQTFRFLYQVAK